MREILGISTAANLGIHALVYLAVRGQGTTCSVQSIARDLKVSHSHLGKVLQQLCQHGLLQSSRGAMGGYRLVVDPEQLQLLEVIELLDGPSELDVCALGLPTCLDDDCPLADIAREVHAIIVRRLGDTPVAEMARACRDSRGRGADEVIP